MQQNEVLKNEIKQLRQESETLNNLLEERETTLDETLSKLNEAESNSGIHNQKQLLKQMENIVNQRINKMEEKIENIIEKKVEEKQRKNEVTKNNTFAETLRKNLAGETIQNAFKISRNNDLVQQTERAKRENNLIIHGVSETARTQKEQEEQDKAFIASFLQVIGAQLEPKTITRIGKVIDGKIDR